jgi:hypothetical protein
VQVLAKERAAEMAHLERLEAMSARLQSITELPVKAVFCAEVRRL